MLLAVKLDYLGGCIFLQAAERSVSETKSYANN